MDDQADNVKYIELPSEVEIGSRLEPISELRKETNFDDASGVPQKQPEIFSVCCRSKVAEGHLEPPDPDLMTTDLLLLDRSVESLLKSPEYLGNGSEP